MNRRFVVGVVAAAAALLVAACGSNGGSSTPSGSSAGGSSTGGSSTAAATGTPVQGGTLTIGSDTPPTTLDPLQAATFANANVNFQIYESLFAFDAKGARIPALALSAKAVDSSTYLIELRPNVKFQDGQDFTADDVVYSWQRISDPTYGSTSSQYIAAIKSVTATSPTEVKLTLGSPDAGILNKLSMPFFPILSKSWASSKSSADLASTTNGTGPYKLSAYQTGQSVTLTRNDNYWDKPKPYINEIDMKFIQDESTRIAALRSGQVQMSWFRDPANLDQIKSIPNLQVSKNAETRLLGILLNLKSGPLTNPKVRQAISMAIDRDALIEAGAPGAGLVSGVYPPIVGTATAAKDLPNYTYDPDKAKQLLAESGNPQVTLTLTLASDASFALDVPMAETMQAQLKQVGVTLNLNSIPWAQVIQNYVAGKFTDMTLVPGVGYPDPSIYATTFLLTRPGKTQLIDDPTLDKMLADANAETDPAKRLEDFDGIQKYVAENVLVLIPYTMPQRFEAWTSVVQNYVPDVQTQRVFLKDAWLKQ